MKIPSLSYRERKEIRLIGNKRNVAISVSNPRNISAFGHRASEPAKVSLISWSTSQVPNKYPGVTLHF